MRNVLVAVSLVASATAHSNPFDHFIGTYTVKGPPAIRNERANSCNRFDFKSLTRFEVKADTNGYRQSHQLYFHGPNGAYNFPVMDYLTRNEIDPESGTYAKTLGSVTNAVSEFGAFSRSESRKVVVAIARKDGTYELSMSEEAMNSKGTVEAGCYYQTTLLR